MMSSCSGTILSIFCDLREIQRRYCRLYLCIKIYRQSTRIIFGAHVAHSLLWNTLIVLHAPVSHLLNLNSSFLYPLTKFHKPNLVGRPIISGCDSPTEQISSFVDYLLQPIAKVQESYLKDITDFLNFIEKTKVAKPTETFQYTHFSSCHPPSVRKGFIKSEALGLLRTNSSKATFEENITQFKRRSRDRGYPDLRNRKHVPCFYRVKPGPH